MYTLGQLNITNVPVEAGLHRCFKDVLKQSDFELERQRIIEFNQKCRYTKRAIDVVPVQFGVGMLPIMMQGMALLHVYLDGSILLAHGGVESGQGLHTKMIQVASRALNVPVDLFHISETSTGSVPNASVTGGSSGSDINGMAVLNACEILSERLKPYRDANPSATWQQLVASAYSNRVNLSATGFFKCPYSENFDYQSGKGQLHVYNTYGAAVAQVEVNCLTGIYTILKVDIVMDVGKSLNPAIDIGQIEGGFVMGIGYHALEEHRYGPDGCLQTSGAGKYHIPSVSSIPLEMNVTLLKDSGNPKAVYSSKGIGEPSLLLSSAVFFAIRDAVVAARSEAGLPSQFTLNSPATVRDILLACTKA
jgi:xanthine dehydrogenase/oxidase